MTDLPFMKLYWQDFLADTDHLSLSELGLYVRILGKMWLSPEASLKPGLRDRLARLPQDLYPETVYDLLTKDENGNFTQKRLKKEWEDAHNTLQLLKEAGRKGGLSRAKGRLKPGSSKPEPDIKKEVLKKEKSLTKQVDLDTWEPDEQDREYAAGYGLDPDRILLDIHDWAANAPLAKQRKRDPRRFWQGWCRREADKAGPRMNGRPADVPDPRDRPLTFDEQRSYERAHKAVPRTTNKPAGEWAGLQVVK